MSWQQFCYGGDVRGQCQDDSAESPAAPRLPLIERTTSEVCLFAYNVRCGQLCVQRDLHFLALGTTLVMDAISPGRGSRIETYEWFGKVIRDPGWSRVLPHHMEIRGIYCMRRDLERLATLAMNAISALRRAASGFFRMEHPWHFRGPQQRAA